MFGQPSTATTSPFASPSNTSTPFGTPATGTAGASTTSFGSPVASTAPFVSSAAAGGGGFSGFGTPATVNTGPTVGGSGGGFGSGAGGAFGSSTVGGFGFGSPQPQQQQQAGTGFGAPPTTPFGSTGTSGGLFGGGAAPASSGGLFSGATPASTGGLFGATNTPATTTTTGFGTVFGQQVAPAASSGSGFGTASTVPGSGFGNAGAPSSGSLFGGSAPATGFGPAPTSSGIFGAAPSTQQQQPSGGIFDSAFGVNNGNNAKVGTQVAQYEATRRNDGNNNTQISIHSVAGMPVYENKSHEELRMEDYSSGNRGTQVGTGSTPNTQTAGTFGTFNGGGFGSSSTNPAQCAFGAPSTSLGGGFGSVTTPSSFGTGAAAAPTASSFNFGAAPATSSSSGGGLFGSTAAAKPATAPGGLFSGGTTVATPGGIFGGTPVTNPTSGSLFNGFGAPVPAPSSGGIFGAPAPSPSTTSLFGSTPAPGGGIFGATPVTPAAPTGVGLFGTTTPAPPPTGGIFGTPAPATSLGGGLFTSTTTPVAQAPGVGGIFGSSTPAPITGGLFGSPTSATGGGFFTNGAALKSPGELFGGPVPSFFGTTPATVAVPAPVTAGVTLTPPAADAVLAQQLAVVEKQKKELAVLEAWRGKSSRTGGGDASGSSLSIVRPSSVFDRDVVDVGIDTSQRLNLLSPFSSIVRYPTAPRSTARIRPRGFGSVRVRPSSIGGINDPDDNTVGKSGGGKLSIGGRGQSPLLSPDRFLGSTTKHLVIKPESLTPKPKIRLLLTNGNLYEEGAGVEGTKVEGDSGGIGKSSLLLEKDALTQTGFVEEKVNDSTAFQSRHSTKELMAKNNPPRNINKTLPSSGGKTTTTEGKTNDSLYDYYQSVVRSPESVETYQNTITTNISRIRQQSSNSILPKLTKVGYSITPSKEALAQMSAADLAAVSGFVIERAGYGSISWDGAVDIRGCDLDTVIAIESRDVAVYDNEEAIATKPPVGSKLNRPAVITIYGIFSKNGGKNASQEAKKKYERKIVKVTKAMGAELLSYDSSIGIWKFRVAHFSRYGLNQDSDDDDDEYDDNYLEKEGENIVSTLRFESNGKSVYSHTKVISSDLVSPTCGFSRIGASMIDDNLMISDDTSEEENVSVTLLSDGGEDFQKIEAAAENTYAKIFQSVSCDHSSDDETATTSITNSKYKEEIYCDWEIFYDDEGYVASEYTSVEVLPPKNSIILKDEVGISATIARRCGVKTATSSATDFGMRMGRSFRVGFGPDGSFFSPRQNSKTIVKARSTLICNSAPLSRHANEYELCTRLLSVHLKHSQRLNTNHSDCPFFSIHQSILRCSPMVVLNDYEKEAMTIVITENKVSELSADVFSLIPILFGNKDLVSNMQRKEAFIKWLQGVCRNDVQSDIDNSNSQKDFLSAIFAALSGMDIMKAESISSEKGLCMLSSLITNTEVGACSYLMQQMEQWNHSDESLLCPSVLIRIFALLCRSLDVEEVVYKNADPKNDRVLDWKRRMVMLLWSLDDSPSMYGGSMIPSLLLQYESHLAKGSVPPPCAWHYNLNDPKHENCILYRLLQVFAPCKTEKISLAHLISPLGHTADQHDTSKSFHFASVLSALDVSEPLSNIQEYRILETYALQLVEANLWEWAIYVLLCTFGDLNFINKAILQRKKLIALDIFLRYYTDDIVMDPHSNRRRSFLERHVGVPVAWFNKAILQRFDVAQSHRHQRLFDKLGLLYQSASFSNDDALTIYEKILPDILVDGGGANYQEVIDFLGKVKSNKMTSWDSLSFSGVIYDFLKLCQVVRGLPIGISIGDPSEERFDELLLQAERLQSTLPKRKKKNSLFFNSTTRASQEMCVAEVSTAVSAIIVHLVILKQRCPQFETGVTSHDKRGIRKLRKKSELIFAWSNQSKKSVMGV